MKLGQYIEHLQKIILDNPEAKDYDVIYAQDDEGNGYNGVNYAPSVGQWDGDSFSSSQDCENIDSPLVVCIN